MLDIPFGGSAGLPCQAGLRPHSRTALWQLVRRLTTKGLVFLRFVAPHNAPVNGKKRRLERAVFGNININLNRNCMLAHAGCKVNLRACEIQRHTPLGNAAG